MTVVSAGTTFVSTHIPAGTSYVVKGTGIALLGNYMAASFVSEAPQGQQNLLTRPQA